MRLVAIGLAAGVFSAFFGVGGGIIAVPLLILVAGLPERTATATSSRFPTATVACLSAARAQCPASDSSDQNIAR